MRFIDSNVLVYSADPRDAAKQQIAKTIVMSARNSNDYVISAQVINEFANVALNKLGKENEDVQKFIWMFREIKTVDVRLAWSSRALEIMKRYGLQFYDSLLLAAAEALGCDEFLTEDLNDGQMYGSVKAVNPFK